MHWGHWTFLDFVFLGIVLLSTGFALTKGLVREVVSIVALVGGFILAVLYYPVPAAWLKDWVRTETLADLIGFMILFLGCLLAGAVISFLINRFVQAASLEWIDRLLGAVFGFLRGWAVASVLVVALVAFPVKEHVLAHSVLAPYLLAGARTVVLVVPKDLKTKFYEEYKKTLQVLNEKRGPA